MFAVIQEILRVWLHRDENEGFIIMTRHRAGFSKAQLAMSWLMLARSRTFVASPLARRWLREGAPVLLDAEKEALLLRLLRASGPVTKRQLSEMIDKGGLRDKLASKARVDRHIQHLTAQGTLVVQRGNGSAGQFALANESAPSR
jgi:hypothetical protein